MNRVVFCSWQLYYDLAQTRDDRKARNVAILRVEQLYPFPSSDVEEALSAYPSDVQVVWVQEEPKNMGAWRTVQDCMVPLLEPTQRSIAYIGVPRARVRPPGR